METHHGVTKQKEQSGICESMKDYEKDRRSCQQEDS